MRRQSDGAEFGAWLFKCNPRLRDFQACMAAAADDRITQWCVARTYRATLIRSGQPVMLWVSGSDAGGPTPGIWAVGQTTSDASATETEGSGESHRDMGQSDLRAGLRLRPLREPVPRAVLRYVPGLEYLEVLRIPAGSNPSWVTRTEFDALLPLVDWPTRAASHRPPAAAEAFRCPRS